MVRLLMEHKGMGGSRLFSVIGAKGGVGTTVISQALSLVISQNLEQPCLLIDCSGGRSSSSIALTKSEPAGKMTEAIAAAEKGD
ncbi:MAG: hypothetical protein AAF350_09455, partial [Pseudomonadota bacterium]